jgi:mono/diheme cytochrome c family protein
MRAFLTGLFIVVSAVAATKSAACAQGAREFTKSEFTRSCGPCHGETGKGDGPIAKSLTNTPADLTKLSQKNGGVFPFSSLYDVIDGRTQVLAHGPREMPVWGDVYTRELQNHWPTDLLSGELIQIMARVRILMLVEYISTLQGK